MRIKSYKLIFCTRRTHVTLGNIFLYAFWCDPFLLSMCPMYGHCSIGAQNISGARVKLGRLLFLTLNRATLYGVSPRAASRFCALFYAFRNIFYNYSCFCALCHGKHNTRPHCTHCDGCFHAHAPSLAL